MSSATSDVSSQADSGKSLVVLRGGTVWPSAGAATSSALAIRGGRILALGADAEALSGHASEVLDLEGGFVLPSFGDGHAHPLFGGLEEAGPAIRGCVDVDGVVDAVRRWAVEHPGQEWITGASYDPTLAPGGEFDATWLDVAVSDRPVVLRAADYHTVWCNTAALKRAGITDTTPDPRLGWIVRRPDGSPRGTLREWHAVDLVLDQAPQRSKPSLVDVIGAAGRTLAAAGITWVQDAWVDPEHVAAYLKAARDGSMVIRTDLAQRTDPDSWREQQPTFSNVAAEVRDVHSPMLTAHTVKFFVDGVLESGTAAVLDPYVDTRPDAPHAHGMPVWDSAELGAAVAAFDAAGFQVHMHAIGDAAVRQALDAIEAMVRDGDLRDRRPTIAHVQLVHPDDLARFAPLGVIANFEPLWAQPDPLQTELTVPRLGTERADLQYPMATLLRSGAHLSFGSDWPVSSHVPLHGIQIAVSRQTESGSPPQGWVPSERLDVEQALAAYTAGVAHQARGDQLWGRLKPGMSADLVWLSDDPRAVEPNRISEIHVRGTWFAGQRIVG